MLQRVRVLLELAVAVAVAALAWRIERVQPVIGRLGEVHAERVAGLVVMANVGDGRPDVDLDPVRPAVDLVDQLGETVEPHQGVVIDLDLHRLLDHGLERIHGLVQVVAVRDIDIAQDRVDLAQRALAERVRYPLGIARDARRADLTILVERHDHDRVGTGDGVVARVHAQEQKRQPVVLAPIDGRWLVYGDNRWEQVAESSAIANELHEVSQQTPGQTLAVNGRGRGKDARRRYEQRQCERENECDSSMSVHACPLGPTVVRR